MKETSQRTKDCMLNRLRKAGFILDTLTAADYTEIKNRLRWRESTYRTALNYLGKKSEADKLTEGFRDYVPTDAETETVKYEFGAFGILLVRFGLRFSEVWDIRYSEGDRSRIVLHPKKSGKPTLVSVPGLPRDTQAALRTWIDEGACEEVTPRMVRYKWSKLQVQGQLSTECVPHTFRHRLITKLIDSGEVTLDRIAQMVGHKQTNTTKRYYHNNPTESGRLYSLLPG